MKSIAFNKKALFNYEPVEQYEAGLILQGWEVKSLRKGHVSLKESYIVVKNGRAWLIGAHVNKWPGAQVPIGSETRERELLLKDSELTKLGIGVKAKGHTIVPIDLHFKGRLIKLTLALARGKKLYDKRSKLKEEDQKREIKRDLKTMGL
jgi:SsrA-binding protein